MQTYILIGETPYPTDTIEQIEVAKRAMLNVKGVDEAEVWVGDPDCPDTYKNGTKLRVR